LFELFEMRQSSLTENPETTVRWIADHVTPGDAERIPRVGRCESFLAGFTEAAQPK
jgi:hypothetical protein